MHQTISGTIHKVITNIGLVRMIIGTIHQVVDMPPTIKIIAVVIVIFLPNYGWNVSGIVPITKSSFEAKWLLTLHNMHVISLGMPCE